jgi:predicted 3-demethylubiquinone-9 3-methyltransferase (glyoxalase superfamily)
MQQIKTFLMFEGKAEEAMNFYISLFDQSAIVNITRYDDNAAGTAGKVMYAVFSLNGQEYMCSDSSVKHAFTFTPSMSLYVDCATEKEIDWLFSELSQDGQILMPLEAYPFSDKFCWVADRYGVSWQLSLHR